LALEYAANNIRFNTVSLGVVNTPMHAKGNHAALAKFHPLGRMGEVSDVVDAVLVARNHKHPRGHICEDIKLKDGFCTARRREGAGRVAV
jgi:NAD(P)-dependent dehydrogenase (short-subunit alcohol dehydrogenase family)